MHAAAASTAEGVQLELTPRVCTLAAGDAQCETEIKASWRAAQPVSVCLVIVDRPQIKRCWDGVSEGSFSAKLAFADDLTVQLRDFELRRVLASAALRVIRETTRYRRKRREPWNLFD